MAIGGEAPNPMDQHGVSDPHLAMASHNPSTRVTIEITKRLGNWMQILQSGSHLSSGMSGRMWGPFLGAGRWLMLPNHAIVLIWLLDQVRDKVTDMRLLQALDMIRSVHLVVAVAWGRWSLINMTTKWCQPDEHKWPWKNAAFLVSKCQSFSLKCCP